MMQAGGRFNEISPYSKPSTPVRYFVDVEGTKNVKQMISLLAITSQFIL